MKFSKAWLQDYVKESLPEIEKLKETVTLNAFEIEEVTRVGDDDILDLKVLPNRAHDALGHKGVAQDICALLGLTFTDPNEYYQDEADTSVQDPKILADAGTCTRFMGVRIDGIQVTDSPDWLKERLNAIGQKSINSIVDITNYVQFAINKPMHAYDATLVSGNALIARYAKEGETLTTLDDKVIRLDTATLVITDEEKPLGLAGVKGGKFSGISPATTSIILESANFDPTLIRKTSQKYNIRTDASKRFENGIADSLVEDGLRLTIALVKKLNAGAKVGKVVDTSTRATPNYKVGVSVSEINGCLGTSYSLEEILDVFSRLGFTSEVVENPRTKMVTSAENYLGVPYKRGASVLRDAPTAFDCSSFTSWLYKESGYQIPRIAIDQYVASHPVSSEPNIGDLIFTNTGTVKTSEGSHYSQVLQQDIPEVAIRTESVEFLSGTKVEGGIDHNGMYVGDGYVIHASSTHGEVRKEKLAESSVFSKGYQFRTIINKEEARIVVTVPPERLDIRIKEDLIEEVVRIKSLSTIKGVLPKLERTGVPHKRLNYENKIRNILYRQGFSDIMTYSFGDEGEVEIVKGTAMDKEKLRSSLSTGVERAFQMNIVNAPLLNVQTVKLYEFGNVFTKTSERRHLALAIDDGKKKSSFTEEVDMLLSEMKRTLGVETIEYETKSIKPYVIEIDFDSLIESLPEQSVYEPLIQTDFLVSYTPVSPYPFIVRDIAVWVPSSVAWEDIHALALKIQSPLIVRIDCFDTFSKEVDGVKKTSYAFRFVLQSKERTLTDDEANSIANQIYDLLKEKGYEIR